MTTRFRSKTDHIAESAHLMNAYSKYLVAYKNKPKSVVDGAEAGLQHYLKRIGDHAFLPLHYEKAMEYLGVLAQEIEDKNCSATTANMHKSAVREFYLWLAKRDDNSAHLEVDAIELFDTDDRTRRSMSTANKYDSVATFAELQKMISVCDGRSPEARKIEAAFRLIVGTGMREMAVQTMQIRHFDYHNGVAYQNPLEGQAGKGARSITVALVKHTPGLFEPVYEWQQYLIREHGFSSKDPMFPVAIPHSLKTMEQAAVMTYPKRFNRSSTWMDTVFKGIAERAGLPYYTPHSFRSVLTRLVIDAAADPLQLVALSSSLGHSQIDTTLGYCQIAPDTAVEVLKATPIGEYAIPIPTPGELLQLSQTERDAILFRVATNAEVTRRILGWAERRSDI